MQFKTFLSKDEEDLPFKYDKFASVEDAIDYLKKNCSIALQSKTKIWRGAHRSLSPGVYYPSSGTRVSANTSNHYTILLDSNSLNHNYPKRSKSFIASTSERSARGYGHTLYRVFPKDETMLSVVNSSDFWDLRIPVTHDDFFGTMSIESMNQYWKTIWKVIKNDRDYAPTLEEAIELLKENKDKAIELVPYVKGHRELDEDNFNEFVEKLPEFYSYKKLGCSLKRIDKIDLDSRTEVWFSDPAVILTKEYINKIGDVSDLIEHY